MASGAAYVFVREGTAWAQQAYLKASDTRASDYFGNSVAVSGDTVVVGARGEASNATGVEGNQYNISSPGAGAVYVFVREGTTWMQQAYLKASNTGEGDKFGWSVAVSGDTVVAGACDEDSSSTGVDGDQSDDSSSKAGAVPTSPAASRTPGISPEDQSHRIRTMIRPLRSCGKGWWFIGLWPRAQRMPPGRRHPPARQDEHGEVPPHGTGRGSGTSKW